jgi:thiosulfate/3-mercaptopyruvate sulfurtransferase
VTGDELARLLAENAVTLLDVRTPEEFRGEAGYPCDPRQGHIEGAANVPVEVLLAGGDLRQLLAGSGVDLEKRIVAYCHSGQRSEVAAAALRAAGLDAVNYEGSWHEWSRRND